jgi:hypothetical protein
MVATLTQALGLVAIALGVGFVYPPAGLIVAGIGLTLFGLALERSK